MAEFCNSQVCDRVRNVYHEAGHCLALLAMGYVPLRAQAFSEWTTVPTPVGNTCCGGFVEPSIAIANMEVICKCIYLVSGVAAEEWACDHQLLQLRPSPDHCERKECRNEYSKAVYTRKGHGYAQVGPSLQGVIKSRVEHDIEIVKAWIDMHHQVYNDLVEAIQGDALKDTALLAEDIWLKYYGFDARRDDATVG